MSEVSKVGRIYSIMSGKGGVGKSTLSSSLAVYYARMGKQVTLLDGDIGQRCADLMLNVQDRVVYDLGDVADKNCELKEALLPHPALPNLTLLAAPQMMTPSDVKRKAMDRIITDLAEASDILLLDAPAGIGKGRSGKSRGLHWCSTVCGLCGCGAGSSLRLIKSRWPWICR